MPKYSRTRVPKHETRPLAQRVQDSFVLDGEAKPEELEKNPAAIALGRLGGKKGGPARAAKLSAAERKAIAKKAAKSRWEKARD